MIPRLYEKDATSFDTFGICPLIDCISCTVTEERNGEFVLEMIYPRDGRWADEIIPDRIVLAAPFEQAEQAEPFRIKEVAFDMSNNVTVQAEHISYALNYVLIGKATEQTRYPKKMFDTLVSNYLLSASCPFSFETDMTAESQTVMTYDIPQVTPMKTILGGMEGSMLDLYGGEYKWTRWTVNLLSSRGEDNGVKIAYRKNLTGLRYDVDISGVYTGAVAFYKSQDTYVQGTRQTIQHTYGFERDIVLDASGEFNNTTPTVAQLNTYAANYLAANAPDPVVSVDVEFVPLWQTDEYKAYEDLEHVNLCDVVEVIYQPLNLAVKAKVVRTVYNVLADRYDEITISSIKSGLADTIYNLMERS